MLKVLELFAGIGACSSALDRLDIEHEIVDAVEIDKYALRSFNAIHGTDFIPQDIRLWDKDVECDLIMSGSPCQDFSVAGKQAGGDEGSGTRSSLMYENIRIIKKLRPKYVIWENVKNLLSKKHRHNFDNYLGCMESMGYRNYYQVLNAKDYGIPQNRERVFTISIRQDIDFFHEFHFPEKQELKLRLKDMLEEQVDEKYYLSDKIIKFYKKNEEEQKAKGNGFTFGVSDGNKVARAITTRAGSRMDDNFIQQVGILDIKGQDCIKRVYSDDGLSPTLTDMQGGNRQPKIVTHTIPQLVSVRKFKIDVERLKATLREAKTKVKMSNNELADELNLPVTQVEHYFRQDKCFAIPDKDVWLKLKSALNITTNEFDESIMTFEEREGVYEKADRVYDEIGLAPTLTQQEEKILIKNNTKQGYDTATDGDSVNLEYPQSETRRGRVGHEVSQTLQTSPTMGVVVAAAQRGREEGQQMETSNREYSNSITTVQKDSLVATKDIDKLRIRKLTPKECFRLMRISR